MPFNVPRFAAVRARGATFALALASIPFCPASALGAPGSYKCVRTSAAGNWPAEADLTFIIPADRRPRSAGAPASETAIHSPARGLSCAASEAPRIGQTRELAEGPGCRVEGARASRYRLERASVGYAFHLVLTFEREGEAASAFDVTFGCTLFSSNRMLPILPLNQGWSSPVGPLNAPSDLFEEG